MDAREVDSNAVPFSGPLPRSNLNQKLALRLALRMGALQLRTLPARKYGLSVVMIQTPQLPALHSPSVTCAALRPSMNALWLLGSASVSTSALRLWPVNDSCSLPRSI